MAGAIYTTRFVREQGTVSGESASPPSGTIWVVRDITVYFGGSLDEISVYVTVLGGGTFFFVDYTPPQPGYSHWDGRQVIYPDENIQWHADQPVDLYITGYELIAP